MTSPLRRGKMKADWSLTLSLACALLITQPANADELPQVPGIVAVNRRVPVDPIQPPWDAIAKVQTNIGTRCTGVLIEPGTVLTSAHCLYNRRTQALLQAGSLHVLFGYNRGDYRWHRVVERYTVGTGFDGAKGALQGSDWARLVLDDPLPNLVAPLPITTRPPPFGATIALAGYNQDRSQVLMADLACHITGAMTAADSSFIAHDCDATRGTSGGPLLVRGNDSWAVVGINIGAARGRNLALPASAFAN